MKNLAVRLLMKLSGTTVPVAAGARRVLGPGEGRSGPEPLMRNPYKTTRGAIGSWFGSTVRAAPFALLRNPRKTGSGAVSSWFPSVVRAAPGTAPALQSARQRRQELLSVRPEIDARRGTIPDPFGGARRALCAAALLIAGPAFGQTPQAQEKAPPAKIPRTADGKPDFTGAWQQGGVSLYGEVAGNNHTTAAVPQAAPARGGGRGERLVYKDEAEAKVQAGRGTTWRDDPTVKCLLPGIPRIFGMPMPFEIVQTPKQIAMLFESFHGWRLIPFGGSHGDPDPSFLGDSIASWDGDTLVVDAVGFNGKIWLDGAGHFTDEQLHVTERYTLNGDTISYEATMFDPPLMNKPYTQRMTFIRLKEGERPREYECIENNQDLDHLTGPSVKAK